MTAVVWHLESKLRSELEPESPNQATPEFLVQGHGKKIHAHCCLKQVGFWGHLYGWEESFRSMTVERKEEAGRRLAKERFTFQERYLYRVVRHMTANTWLSGDHCGLLTIYLNFFFNQKPNCMGWEINRWWQRGSRCLYFISLNTSYLFFKCWLPYHIYHQWDSMEDGVAIWDTLLLGGKLQVTNHSKMPGGTHFPVRQCTFLPVRQKSLNGD